MKELDTIFLFATGFNDMRHNFTSSVPNRLGAVWPSPACRSQGTVDTLKSVKREEFSGNAAGRQNWSNRSQPYEFSESA